MSVDQELPWEALGVKSNGFIFSSPGPAPESYSVNVCQMKRVLTPWLVEQTMREHR